MGDHKTIVVGYDGSVEAGQAVRWAARQAACRNWVLDVVHCSLWPLLTHNLGPVEGIADSGLQHYAEAARDEGLAHAAEAAPGLHVRPVLRYGWPGQHLREASAGSAMLVVGSRGIGGFMGLLVGSVREACALATATGAGLLVVHVIRTHFALGRPGIASTEDREAARGAALIVVGSKGQGLVPGTVGSTAHAVLHHARAPVLIARHSSTTRPGTMPPA
jgi:nucleotide-binding universal stress UspA family protein